MLIEVLVVTAHKAPCTALGNGSMEGTQIQLVEGTVAHTHIDVAAPCFLFVESIVLDATRHAIALQALYVGYAHARGKDGVLAHVFKVAAVERCAIQIDTRAQQHRFLAIARFLAHHASVKGGKAGLPRSGKASESRERSARVIGPTGMVPFVPLYLHAHPVRAVAGIQFGYTQTGNAGARELRLGITQSHFLFKSHLAEQSLDASLHVVGRLNHCKNTCHE